MWRKLHLMLVTTLRPMSVKILMEVGQIWYHKWDPAYAKIKDDPSNIGNHLETEVLRSINYRVLTEKS